jgi:hypothetical protein
MVDWAAWEWNANNRNDSGFVSNTSTGFLLHSMLRAKKSAPKILTKEIQNDIKSRIRHSKKILKLDESVNNLFELFIENGIIDRWIIKHILRGKN